jgi:hypothetical protein
MSNGISNAYNSLLRSITKNANLRPLKNLTKLTANETSKLLTTHKLVKESQERAKRAKADVERFQTAISKLQALSAKQANLSSRTFNTTNSRYVELKARQNTSNKQIQELLQMASIKEHEAKEEEDKATKLLKKLSNELAENTNNLSKIATGGRRTKKHLKKHKKTRRSHRHRSA